MGFADSFGNPFLTTFYLADMETAHDTISLKFLLVVWQWYCPMSIRTGGVTMRCICDSISVVLIMYWRNSLCHVYFFGIFWLLCRGGNYAPSKYRDLWFVNLGYSINRTTFPNKFAGIRKLSFEIILKISSIYYCNDLWFVNSLIIKGHQITYGEEINSILHDS